MAMNQNLSLDIYKRKKINILNLLKDIGKCSKRCKISIYTNIIMGGSWAGGFFFVFFRRVLGGLGWPVTAQALGKFTWRQKKT